MEDSGSASSEGLGAACVSSGKFLPQRGPGPSWVAGPSPAGEGPPGLSVRPGPSPGWGVGSGAGSGFSGVPSHRRPSSRPGAGSVHSPHLRAFPADSQVPGRAGGREGAGGDGNTDTWGGAGPPGWEACSWGACHQVLPLTGSRTRDPSVRVPVLSPPSRTRQGSFFVFSLWFSSEEPGGILCPLSPQTINTCPCSPCRPCSSLGLCGRQFPARDQESTSIDKRSLSGFLRAPPKTPSGSVASHFNLRPPAPPSKQHGPQTAPDTARARLGALV